jgi:protein-S-isoprenylcysteine O-methyltransferase Ste14
MIGYIVGFILMGILGYFIYCCLSISNKYSERELHEIYDEAYRNYRKKEKEKDKNESAEKE